MCVWVWDVCVCACVSVCVCVCVRARARARSRPGACVLAHAHTTSVLTKFHVQFPRKKYLLHIVFSTTQILPLPKPAYIGGREGLDGDRRGGLHTGAIRLRCASLHCQRAKQPGYRSNPDIFVLENSVRGHVAFPSAGRSGLKLSFL